jgi:ankyrin repeat protein
MTDQDRAEWLAAARKGDTAKLQTLTARPGWDANARSARGLSALHEAATNGHGDAVRFLASAGVGLELRDANDLTALSAACIRGGELAEAGALALVLAGADVNATRESDELTPLGAASGPGACTPALLNALIDRGARVNGVPDAQWPPLLDAVQNNQLAAIELLVARGADLGWRCQAGKPEWMDKTLREIAELERFIAAPLLAELERKGR